MKSGAINAKAFFGKLFIFISTCTVVSLALEGVLGISLTFYIAQTTTQRNIGSTLEKN